MSEIVVPRSFRLMDELEVGEKGMDGPTNISYGLDESSSENLVSLSDWIATIIGMNGPFADRVTTLRIVCGMQYPQVAPSVRFVSKVNLPFVDGNGMVIPSMFPLLGSWNPKTTIHDILKELDRQMNANGVPAQPPEGSTY